MSKTIKIINDIIAIETIAEGHGIRELAQLRERYGYGNWLKNVHEITCTSYSLSLRERVGVRVFKLLKLFRARYLRKKVSPL